MLLNHRVFLPTYTRTAPIPTRTPSCHKRRFYRRALVRFWIQSAASACRKTRRWVFWSHICPRISLWACSRKPSPKWCRNFCRIFTNLTSFSRRLCLLPNSKLDTVLITSTRYIKTKFSGSNSRLCMTNRRLLNCLVIRPVPQIHNHVCRSSHQ